MDGKYVRPHSCVPTHSILMQIFRFNADITSIKIVLLNLKLFIISFAILVDIYIYQFVLFGKLDEGFGGRGQFRLAIVYVRIYALLLYYNR